jgi:hypothetical protein
MKNQYDENYLIVWQKWFDPFGEDDAEQTEVHPQTYESEEDDETDFYEDSIQPQPLAKPIKAIATPMGLIPYNENTASGKIFNFWVGHTNFTITKDISKILEKIDGVETLDIFTRYRFRISVGKAFDSSRVMKKINDTIYDYLENNIL